MIILEFLQHVLDHHIFLYLGPAEKLRQHKLYNPVQNRNWTGFLFLG
jgi:hypothetical protein